jgi:hypothetical protein
MNVKQLIAKLSLYREDMMVKIQMSDDAYEISDITAVTPDTVLICSDEEV